MANKIFGGILIILAIGWYYNHSGGGVFGPPSGPRSLAIIHQSQEDTHEQGRMFVELRDGGNADYLKSKGHKLEILDADSVDEDGNPDVYTQNWMRAAGVTKPPFLGLKTLDDKVLLIRPLSANETSTSIIATVQEYGGGF